MGLEVAEGSLEPRVEVMRSEGAEDPVVALSDSCEALDLNAKEQTADSNGHLDEAVRGAQHIEGTPGEVTEVAPDGTKVEEVSPLQVHTKKWSDFNTVSAKTFGEQGLYGSFSDFLSDFPADSSPTPQVSAPQVISDTDFFEWPATESTSLPGVSPELQPERPHLAPVQGVMHEPVEQPIDSDVWAHQEPELFRTQAQQDFHLKQGPVEQQPVQAWSDLPAEQEQTVLGAAETTDPYPGWYYDYQVSEWRQVEGYTATATVSGGGLCVQNAEQAALKAVDLSSSQLGESQTNVEQTGVVQSQLGLAESQSWATQTAATQTVDEYPGWTWDYDAQTWVSVPSYNESWQNTSGQTQLSGTQSYGQDSWYGQQVQSVNDQSQFVSYNGQQEPLRQQPQALYSGFTSDSTNVVNTAFVPETKQWQGEQQYINASAGRLPQTSIPYMNGDQSWMASASNSNEASTSQSLPSDSSFNYSGSIIQNNFQQPHWGGAAQYNYYSQFTYPTAAPPKNVHEAMRTCVGRPPHSLATFGFGGKLVFMKVKDPVTLHTSNGDQAFASGEAWMPGPVQVQSLGSYLPEEQTYAGPLMGGGVNMKELNKWIDDRISTCPPYDSLRLLLGLLKVGCQHYGKFRSQIANSSISSKEEDGPEAALAKLLADSGVEQGSYSRGSFGGSQTLLGIPSAQQLQATALEVKRLLVSGKRKDALKCAQEGQLWGPALILARQLGEKFYSDTVTEMAQRQFVAGSPLRTLSLLLAGQPAEVFAVSTLQARNSMDGTTSGADLTQMKSVGSGGRLSVRYMMELMVPYFVIGSHKDGVGGMLEEWQENLAIMAANRTPGDERVILHLGDCLWRVRGEVPAAHMCYLVAEANLEPYSGNSRLCLIGADHCKYPRTYASAEAIQRTEIYEYAKVLGNPQYILLPFQAYKLIYAQMLVEAGKTVEAFRYCQTVLKTLKTAGRTPDVETYRVVATNLEDRLRMHMQDGHGSKLAPGKLVNKFLSTMDWSISRIIGGPPPSVPEDPYNNGGEQYGGNSIGSRNSPGNRSGVSMMPSASMERLPAEPNRGPSRSQSEPDFGRNAKEGGVEVNSGLSPGNANTGPGRLGRLGSTFLQKASGLWGSQKNKAKLGEANKFYYDENLKKWVEEGVEPTPEVAPPPPPPTTSNFFGSSAPEESHTPPAAAAVASKPGTPPMPPSSCNQFSSRRQSGVRSRYVDTFNKGGAAAPAKSVLTSLVPAPRPAGGMPSMPAMFVPTPVPSTSESTSEMGDNFMDGGSTPGHESSSLGAFPDTADSDSNLNTARYSTPPPTFLTPSTTIPGVPSADNGFGFPTPETTGRDLLAKNGGPTGFGSAHARASSWGGYETSFQNAYFPGEGSSYRASSDGFSGSEYVPPVASISTSPNTYTDFYNPSSGEVSASLPSPPALTAPSAALGMEGSGVTEIRDPTRDLVEQQYKASQSADSLVGEEMQEVEL